MRYSLHMHLKCVAFEAKMDYYLDNLKTRMRLTLCDCES